MGSERVRNDWVTELNWTDILFSVSWLCIPRCLVKNNIVQEPGILGPLIKVNWKWPNRRWQWWTPESLGISEVKWTGMGKFNSDNHYIYHFRQESLRKWSSHHGQQKSPKCSTWVQTQNWQNDLCFQGKPFNITVMQVYAPTGNAEDAEVEWFYEDLQDLLELTIKKDVLGLECKSRKSRNTWSNRKIWPWRSKWSRSKANRVLQENTLVIANNLFQ